MGSTRITIRYHTTTDSIIVLNSNIFVRSGAKRATAMPCRQRITIQSTTVSGIHGTTLRHVRGWLPLLSCSSMRRWALPWRRPTWLSLQLRGVSDETRCVTYVPRPTAAQCTTIISTRSTSSTCVYDRRAATDRPIIRATAVSIHNGLEARLSIDTAVIFEITAIMKARRSYPLSALLLLFYL